VATRDPGTVVGGHYTVQAAISSGAMGAVHRALDGETGRYVAVKRLLDPTHIARFEIEARLLAQLDHPRVVRVVDHFRDGGDYFIVMELIDGESLHDRLATQGTPGLPVEDVIEWGGQACEALDYIHDQHVVHRDVKPHNLILAGRGVVLVDFGVARELGESTHGTIAVGTPRFMAPEVFSGGHISERSDVFSLAVTLVTLIAGAPPSYTDRAPLTGRYLGVSPDLDAALRTGMEFMPERRIASAAAFAEALGRPLTSRQGASLVTSLDAGDGAPRSVIEGIVRAAAGVFDAAAASIALADQTTGGLIFHAAWGAGAREITGVRLAPGQGIAGAVHASGQPIVLADCRSDPRFAADVAKGTNYVPVTMLVLPLLRRGASMGTLTLLDRRDGQPYGPEDVSKAQLFADLAISAL
jgi:predicted Ser/Thr protein kinase